MPYLISTALAHSREPGQAAATLLKKINDRSARVGFFSNLQENTM